MQDAALELESAFEFVFRFILQGSVDLQVSEGGNLVAEQRLQEEDAFVIPDNMSAKLKTALPGTQILKVSLPAF